MVTQSKKPQQINQGASSAPPIIPNKDLFHRLNYTYQASLFLSSLGLGHAAPISTTVDRKGKRKAVELADSDSSGDGAIDFARLARDGMSSGKGMSVHNQLKLDPSLKRSLCRVCSTVLVPGLTSRVRIRPSKSHGNTTYTTCLTCSTVRSIPAPPTAITVDHQLDGPKRRKRREKLARRAKVGSTEREQSSTGGEGGESGHGLWRGDQRIDGWGIMVRQADERNAAKKSTARTDIDNEEEMMNS